MRDNMAEWLRRQPAKLMGYARVGSNPTVVVLLMSPDHLRSFIFTNNVRTWRVKSVPGGDRTHDQTTAWVQVPVMVT